MMTRLTAFKEPSRLANYRPDLLRRAAVLAAKIALAVAVLILNVIALSPAKAADNDNKMIVEIANFTYSPNVITITPGTTVTWVNHDDIPHTVTATSKTFRSQALDTDDAFTFTFTFTTPGDYAYFCSLHPHMTGKVVVGPAAGHANRSRNRQMLTHNGL